MSLIEAEALGGEDKRIIEKHEQGTPYYDDLNHFLRSLAHQSNHSKHAKGIIGPDPGKPRLETMSRIPGEWYQGHLPVIRSRNQK